MAGKIARQSMAAVWFPAAGPFSAATPFQRGQAGLGDITLPGSGERTIFYGTSAFGSPIPLGVTRTAPGTPTTTIENYLTLFRDAVQKMREFGQCRYLQLRIHDCISLDHPAGWSILVHLENGQAGDTTIGASVNREFGDTRIPLSTPFTPVYGLVWVSQALTRLTTTEAQAANSIDR